MRSGFPSALFVLLFAASLAPAAHARTGDRNGAAAAPVPSSAAQRAFDRAAGALVQIRVLLSGVRSKSEAGSGFFVSGDGLLLTNYHVISRLALEPGRYSAEYVGTDGRTGKLALVAIDVAHDLALLRAEGRRGPFLALAPAGARPLRIGQRIFALGNPLDLGFAIAEGTYNGLIDQYFHEQIFFTGALNPGMSGGPALDEDGRVIGVNVATHRDGELASFLVPAERAAALLSNAKPPPDGNFKALVTRQLLEHQERVAQRVLAAPLPTEPLGDYEVPVSPGEWIRCWAERAPDDDAYVQVRSHRCSSASGVFVSDRLSAGGIGITHQFGESASSLRFLRRHSEGFAQEGVGPRRGSSAFGATRCIEDFVSQGTGTLRAVVCARAYREHPGLYDFTVAAASSDSSRAGLQTQLQVRGFAWDNGLRIVRHVLEAIRWNGPSS